MKRLLLVDDDALVTRTYRDRLSAHGFHVNTAADGATAITMLRSARPDLVVLDLMMPNISGVEVLKFIRGEPRLATTPVVVLTNAYLNDLGREAAAIGIERALLKAQCSPSVLMSVIDGIFEAKKAPNAGANTVSALSARRLETPAAATSPPKAPANPSPAAAQSPDCVAKDESAASAGERLLAASQGICADLRRLFRAFAHAPATGEQKRLRLQDFYRQAHALTGMAGQTEYGPVTQLASVFEALLYVLMNDPARNSPSVMHTLANLVDCLELLFRKAREARLDLSGKARVLLVDDDPVSNRLASTALQEAHLQARSTEDPQLAWQWLQQEQFDIVLLDIEMPGVDGFELCKRLRSLPAYAKTPVIYVTIHTDFQTRAKSILNGGDDLIAKPILPMELAAKVVMHLLKGRVAN